MKENLLIHQAFKYEVGSSKSEIPKNYNFNVVSGYWVNEATNNPHSTRSRRNKAKNKEDIETEGQKR